MKSVLVSFFIVFMVSPGSSRAEAPKGAASSFTTETSNSVPPESGKVGANQKRDSEIPSDPPAVQNDSSGRELNSYGNTNIGKDNNSENSGNFRHNDNNEEAPVPHTIRIDPPLAKP